MMKSKMKFVLLAAFSLCVFVSATIQNNKLPDDGYTNLQVLPKDISHEELSEVMDGFKEALGVKCGFCHARNADTSIHKLDFASDANEHKDAARYMMRMTADINKLYFNWDKSTQPDTLRYVTCITCHRGLKEPDADAIAEQMKIISPPTEEHNK
jgi:hypothetical protein